MSTQQSKASAIVKCPRCSRPSIHARGTIVTKEKSGLDRVDGPTGEVVTTMPHLLPCLTFLIVLLLV